MCLAHLCVKEPCPDALQHVEQAAILEGRQQKHSGKEAQAPADSTAPRTQLHPNEHHAHRTCSEGL